MEQRKQEFKSLKELYNTPANLRLKYIAIVIGVIIPILIMTRIFWPNIPVKLDMFFRGCAGLCAIVFVIIVGIIVYRVNSAFIKQ